MRSLFTTSALVLCAAIASPAAAVNLIGQSVSANYTVLSGSNFVQFSSPQVVGAGTEFNGSYTDGFGQNWTLALDVTATGFAVNINNGVNGNIRRSNGEEYIRFTLSGLSGIGPLQFVSYTCTPPASFACGVVGGGPDIVASGSDASSAFFALSGIRNGERYEFSFGAIPEPASWAMMIGGFGLVGGAIRARRTTAVRFATA